jgi:hypothetical protein
MLAYDYPLLGIFWTVLMVGFAATVFCAVVLAFIDNLRRHDHSGWAKAGWAFLILVVPLLGTVIYIAARPAEARAI